MSQLLPARVLIVDNDPLFIRKALIALQGSVELQVVTSRDAALAATVDWSPDVVVIDSLIGDEPAFALIDEMRQQLNEGPPRIVYLSRGAGAIQRMLSDGTSFLGVVTRDSGTDGLRKAVRCALQSPVTGRGFIP